MQELGTKGVHTCCLWLAISQEVEVMPSVPKAMAIVAGAEQDKEVGLLSSGLLPFAGVP